MAKFPGNVPADNGGGAIILLGWAPGVGATPLATATPGAADGLGVSSANLLLSAAGIPIALGQGLMAASMSVAIASDQSAVPVTLPVPTENQYLASGSRNSTQTQADQTNTLYRGIAVILDVTVIGTGNITLEIDAKDSVSGKYYVLLTGAAVSSNSTNVYTVYPSIVNTANVSASNVLPKTWRIKVTANNGNAVTYSVGYNLLP